MVERIVPKDPRLAAREQRAIEELRANYPDGIVTRIDTTHKRMGERLTKLYRDLGYESRADMLAALGFTLVVSTGGGRQAVDHEALFAELERRYEGKAKPTSIGILKHDNPDLSATIKTVGNKSNELFGHTMTVELIERGLLDKKLPPQRESFEDDEIRETVDALRAKYANVKDKPKWLTELKELEPGSAKVLEYLSSNKSRSTRLFGCSITRHLKSCGVLAADAASIDDDAVVLLLDTLQELYQRKPNDEKPKSIAALIADQPEHAETLNAGKKKRLVTKDILMDRGILATPKSVLQARAKALKERCVRNAKVSELARMYTGSGCAEVVLPDEQVEYLRPGVAGVDLKYNYELRETIVTSIGGDLSVGDALDATFGDSPSYYSKRNLFLSSNGTNVARIRRSGGSDFLTEMTFEDPTPLKQHEGAEVIKVEYVEGVQVARIRYRFLETLSHETLLYALYRVGALSDDELYANDDSWRTRLESMPEDPSRSDGSENTAPSGNEKIELDSSTGEQPDPPAKLQFKLGNPDAEQASGQTDTNAAKLHFKLGKPDAEQASGQTDTNAAKLHFKLGKPNTEQAAVQAGVDATNNSASLLTDKKDGIEIAADSNTWTFNLHQRTKGRRFSIEVPDQWTPTPEKDGKRLAYYRTAGDSKNKTLEMLYVASNDYDIPTQLVFRKGVIPENRIQLDRGFYYKDQPGRNVAGGAINDWLVDGVNCQVIVFEFLITPPMSIAFSGELIGERYEYIIKPVSYDHDDALHISNPILNQLDANRLRMLALAVARTVKLDNPVELEITSKLSQYQNTLADLDSFNHLVLLIHNGICLSAESHLNANLDRDFRRQRHRWDPVENPKECAPIIAEAWNEHLNVPVSYFGRLVDILESQLDLGNADFEKMRERVGEFGDDLVKCKVKLGNDELEREVESLGIISIPAEYQTMRDRWASLDPSRPDTNENNSFDLKLANIDFEFTVGTSQKT